MVDLKTYNFTINSTIINDTNSEIDNRAKIRAKKR